uniref:Enoyl reductase (ER) domain-containing protein n=3 Tax=Brassica TaxID=3705 RepID=M4D767_BRACM
MDKTSFSSCNKGKPIRCKAAICRKAGEALVIEEIQVDPPQAYEVRIKIICTSLCHTDITYWKLTHGPRAKFPKILGHEAVGVVESIGEHVDGFKQGDVVLPVFYPQCEECKDCKSPKSNWCARFCDDFLSNTRRYGTSSRFKDSSGEIIHHHIYVSSFSEYTVVDIAHLVKISPEIPVHKAALLSCCVSTGVGAAWKVAGVEEGSTVAIFGLGAVGLAVAEGARLHGASKIIGVDLNPDKFEIGKRFGITDFINTASCGEKTISQVIKEMTGGGVDYSFECIGLASLMEEAFNSSRTGSGKTVILGMEKNASPISLDSRAILRGRSVHGSLFGGLKPKLDIPILVDRYLKKIDILGLKKTNGLQARFMSGKDTVVLVCVGNEKWSDRSCKNLNLTLVSLSSEKILCLSDPRRSEESRRPLTSMAESVASQTPSLSEQYHLEKEVKQDTSAKPVEVAPEVTSQAEEVSTDKASEESPAEDKSESPPAASEEAPPAVVEEETPAAVEESNDGNASEEVVEETPDEIKLETAPADFRFPTTNQTRHCFTRYIEYHRCVAAKGDDAPECDKFSKFYRSLCPGEWVDKWNEQRENGTFPGPL